MKLSLYGRAIRTLMLGILLVSVCCYLKKLEIINSEPFARFALNFLLWGSVVGSTFDAISNMVYYVFSDTGIELNRFGRPQRIIPWNSICSMIYFYADRGLSMVLLINTDPVHIYRPKRNKYGGNYVFDEGFDRARMKGTVRLITCTKRQMLQQVIPYLESQNRNVEYFEQW